MYYPLKILNKRKYFLCFINAFLDNLCLYFMPVVLSIFLSVPFSLKKFKYIIISIIVLKSLEILFNSIWEIKVLPFLQANQKDLQISYFKRISNMSISQINNIHSVFLKKQLDIVCEETTSFLNEIMMTINGFCIAISIFLIKVWKQSIVMFFVCVVFIIFIVIYNTIISNSNIKRQKEYNDKNSKYNATTVDFLQNVLIVKNFDALNYAVDKMENKFDDVKKPLKKLYVFNSLRWDGINALVYIMYVIVLISLFFRMKNGEDIFNYIIFYASIFGGLTTELRGVASLFIHFNKFKSSNDQIEKIIKDNNTQNKIRTWNDITLKDIEFSYKEESNNKIFIPYFNMRKGDKISIIGESGQGKTTLLSLFCRFYEVDDKNFLIDGIPTSKTPDFAYISQNSEFLDLSIYDNLCLGKNISKNTLNTYLKDAGLIEWIESLEKGLDSVVGEKGVKLSAGQKQRLNLIRGIILDKDIYILDEPTANLDIVSEEKIIEMIKKYLSKKTCLIVTHRLKLTKICNKHYEFKNKILEKKSI